MNPAQPEFIVVNVVESRDNLIAGPYRVLIGRCGDVPITKGSTFHSLYQYQPRRYPDELGNEPVRGPRKPIAIEVVEILTMNRSFDQLGQGMTGSLVVRGEGLESIQPGWVIGDPVPRNARAFPGAPAPELTTASPQANK